MAACSTSTDSASNIPDYEYTDVNSKQFHVGSFRNVWLENLTPSNYSYQDEDEDTFDTAFANEMGIATETLSEIKAICSLDSLCCHPVDQPPDTEVVPPEPTLRTLRQRKRRQDYKDSLKINKIGRHDRYADELEQSTIGRKAEEAVDMIPEGELILTINIYYPSVFEKFKYIRPHMTLLMTGSHSLADLKDAIFCVSDLQVCGEFSNMPDMATEFSSKDHYKSSFFFFEGVFYNDMRSPECQDISMVTIDWAKSRNFPPYGQAKMEDTRFMDLNVKVGFPYLYCHQGDCEHLVIITDVRLSHKSDCLDRRLYPLLTHKHRVATRRCTVCHVYIGRWITINDRFAPSEPCLFCDKCFRTLHYDAQGHKLGDFLSYSYVDPGVYN